MAFNPDKKHARHAVNKKKVTFEQVPLTAEAMEAHDRLDGETLSEYICEVCGKTESLTQKDAFNAGWDYPPFIGMWGVVSPRTCGDCGIEHTAYWQLITVGGHDLSEKHLATIQRILGERLPENPAPEVGVDVKAPSQGQEERES